MLEEIGLTGLLNRKVKCENKLRKTRLSFPQASHCSDTLSLDSELLFFSATHFQATHRSPSASYLPSSCQQAQASAQVLPRPGEPGAARRFATAGNWEVVSEASRLASQLLPESRVTLPVPSPNGPELYLGWYYAVKEESGVRAVEVE